MIVQFSKNAEQDLEQIADYIAQDNPRRALSFVQELRQATISIGEFPQAWPLVARNYTHPIRYKTYRDYLIFYTIEDDAVVIRHITNGARDYEAILG